MAENGPGLAAYDDFAAYYDVSDTERAPEIAYYCSLVRGGTRSLLELACGTGTITIPMARKLAERSGPSARVVGIDLSNKMLAVARGRAPDIEWIRCDMRRPRIGGAFDLVICCFHVLQLLLSDDDLLQCFRNVREILTPDGSFAFSIYQPNLKFLNAPHADHAVRSFADARGRQLEVREQAEYDSASRILANDWRVVEQGNADAVPIARMHLLVRQYFPEEIERLLAAAGLAMCERYGDYDRSPFTANSKRQVIVCRRASPQ
jgi:SAM-dependent methyltransferase